MTIKIFARERRKTEKGERKPRFRIVGVSGQGLKLYAPHLRKKELEQLAAETGGVVVYLAGGDRKGEHGGDGSGK